MSEPASSSPMAAWALALVLALPIPMPLLAPSMTAQPTDTPLPNAAFYRHEIAEFLQPVPGHASRPRGIMLAMSGGSCATAGPRQLAPGGVDLYVVYYSSATLQDFETVLDPLLAGRPDFVVIQDTVLIQPARTAFGDAYGLVRGYWRERLLNVVQHAAGIQASQDLSWRCAARRTPLDTWPLLMQQALARIRPYSEHSAQYLRQFLDPLNRANIPILIVSPPANEFSAAYRDRVFASAQRLALGPAPIPGLSWHRHADLTPAAEFMDPTHLAPAANGPYRSWLNARIQATLGIHGH